MDVLPKHHLHGLLAVQSIEPVTHLLPVRLVLRADGFRSRLGQPGGSEPLHYLNTRSWIIARVQHDEREHRGHTPCAAIRGV